MCVQSVGVLIKIRGEEKTMTKITTPIAVLIGSFIIASAILLRVDITAPIIGTAHADVAGMGYYSLQSDDDFKKAVRHVVENYCVLSDDVVYLGSDTWGNLRDTYISC